MTATTKRTIGRVSSLCLGAVLLLALMAAAAAPWGTARAKQADDDSIVLAVEFNSHAACAHVARHQGWYEAQGIRLRSYDSYVTGMALAAALMRGEVDAAYLCLIPAVNVYANGRVPLKVVAGTHRYGYAMVVDPEKIGSVKDLERPGLRIGCSSEGSPTDAIVHRTIDTNGLNERSVMGNVLRMNPPKQLLALKMGQLDAAVVPEQYPGMAEELGFKVLVRAQDLWPGMQGSVLVVTDELIRTRPGVVKKLVEITESSTRWITEHPKESSAIIASMLNGSQGGGSREEAAKLNSRFTVSPEVVLRSFEKGLEYRTDIDPDQIDATIAYMAKLGYIRKGFDSSAILDLGWLNR